MTWRPMLLMALAAATVAVEPGILAGSVSETRQVAESDLAQARETIAAERSRLMAVIQTAHKEADQARSAAEAAQRQADAQESELALCRQESRHNAEVLAALVDRTLVSAGMPPTTSEAFPPRERIRAALAAIDARVAALPFRLQLRRTEEPVIARDGRILPTPVLRFGEARAIALGEDPSQRGLLARNETDGPWRVVGPSFATGITDLPFDPDGSIAAQTRWSGRSLGEWIRAGRAWIWPILLVALVGVLLSLWRSLALWRLRIDPRRLLQVATLVQAGRANEAERQVTAGTGPLDRVLTAGLAARDRPREVREAVLEQALIAETPGLQRGLGLLVVLASVAPLLGLLGTVTGMIDMFGVIAQEGAGGAKSLSGGISEALICTQAGMITAIPLLLVHAILSRIAERRLLLLEEAACGLLGMGTDP